MFDATDGQCGDKPDPSRQFDFYRNRTLMLVDSSQIPPERRCIQSSPVPNVGSPVQVWSKPLPQGAVAVFALNSVSYTSPLISIKPFRRMLGWQGQFGTTSMQIQMPFSEIGLQAAKPASLRDLWKHTDNGTVSEELVLRVPVADSVFVVLTPINSSTRT